MLRLVRASDVEKRELLLAARAFPTSSPNLMTVREGVSVPYLPKGFVHDVSRSNLGHGQEVFERAKAALLRWEQFDLGWVQLLSSQAEIITGQLIGIEAYTAYLWSMSFNRIVEVIDCPGQFGFLYATTSVHMEQGQERFVLEYDPQTGSVSYVIEAVSRPRHPLARLAYPFSRAMQRRFARDSHARLKHSLQCLPA